MTRILLALALVSLSACGTAPRAIVSLPSVAPTKKAVQDAHTSTVETRDAVAKTKERIAEAIASAQAASKATGEADFILKIAPVIEQLKEAQKINEEALAAATVAESRASTAEAQVTQLEAKQAVAQEDNAKLVDRLNQVEPALGHQTWLAWKWRIIAFATWAGIAGIILAKFYFKLSLPFL